MINPYAQYKAMLDAGYIFTDVPAMGALTPGTQSPVTSIPKK